MSVYAKQSNVVDINIQLGHLHHKYTFMYMYVDGQLYTQLTRTCIVHV